MNPIQEAIKAAEASASAVINTKIASTATFGGSVLTAGSGIAANSATGLAFNLSEIGVVVGILTAVLGLFLQGYLGWQKLKLQKQAYAALGTRADLLDSQKAEL